MLPELIKVIKSKIATIKNYPGQSVVVNGRGLRDMEAESYGLAGVGQPSARRNPSHLSPYGGTRRGACVGGHNYKIRAQFISGRDKNILDQREGDTVKACDH